MDKKQELFYLTSLSVKAGLDLPCKIPAHGLTIIWKIWMTSV